MTKEKRCEDAIAPSKSAFYAHEMHLGYSTLFRRFPEAFGVRARLSRPSWGEGRSPRNRNFANRKPFPPQFRLISSRALMRERYRNLTFATRRLRRRPVVS